MNGILCIYAGCENIHFKIFDIWNEYLMCEKHNDLTRKTGYIRVYKDEEREHVSVAGGMWDGIDDNTKTKE